MVVVAVVAVIHTGVPPLPLTVVVAVVEGRESVTRTGKTVTMHEVTVVMTMTISRRE